MPKTPEINVPAEIPASYEAALQELERLVARLESGEMPLDQLLSGYQRGAELLKYCERILADAQQRVQVLEGDSLSPFNA